MLDVEWAVSKKHTAMFSVVDIQCHIFLYYDTGVTSSTHARWGGSPPTAVNADLRVEICLIARSPAPFRIPRKRKKNRPVYGAPQS